MAGLEGRQLGGCVLVRLIRHGGAGEVYLAEQPELGRQVAVKIPRLAVDPADDLAVASAISQFVQAAEAVTDLRHPNILPIYGVGVEGNLPYLTMQYVRDGSLADLIAPGLSHRLDLPLPPAVVVGLVVQVAAALQVAHDHQPRIVHGHLTPANLLALLLAVNPGLAPGVTAGSPPGTPPAAFAQVQLLVADFGLPFTNSDPATPRQDIAATPYTAPEQFTGPSVPESDQYALACVAFELLTNRRVFDGAAEALFQQHSFASPPQPRQYNLMLPPAVDPVLLRALAKSPTERFRSVDEFARVLATALDPAAPAPDLPLAEAWHGSMYYPGARAAVPSTSVGTFPPPPMARPPSGPIPTGPIPTGPVLSAPFVSGAPPVAPPPTASGPGPRVPNKPTRRTVLSAGIAGGVLLVAAGGGFYWFTRNHAATQTGASPTSAASAHHLGDTLGVYRSTTGTFILQETLATNSAVYSLTFGAPGLVPITGDWDGTGIDKIGVYHPASLTFILSAKNTPGAAISHRFLFGAHGDIPLAGDWTGTGRDTIGVFRPTTGQFFLKNTLGSGPVDFTMQFGQIGDVPVVGDWHGTGRDGIGVFRPSTQTFYLVNTVCDCTPPAVYTVLFGQQGDLPLVGDWTHAGLSGLGVFVPERSLMALKDDATTPGPADFNVVFGSPGDIPLAGHWGLGA